MKFFDTLTITSLASSLLLLGCSSPEPSVHPDTTAAGWSDLFNADFSNAKDPKGVWTISDGIITASEDHNLWSPKEYDNFIIDLEFKTAEGTNSGVVVYASDLDNWIPNSVEIQIADDYAKQWSDAPATWQCGAAFGRLAATERRVKHPGEWNRYTITAKDQIIEIVLNGAIVNRLDMSKWTHPTTNPDGSEIPSWLSKPLAGLPTRGHIGFQGKHAGAPIYFRNIRVKEL